VRTGVVEIFALQEDSNVAVCVRSEAWNLGDDRRATGVGAVQFSKLELESRVCLGDLIGGLELVERFNQRLGNKPTTELAEVWA
jgi:hypothetical protein